MKKKEAPKQSKLNYTNMHPALKANIIWRATSMHLTELLGPITFSKFFENIKPVTITNDVLILETHNYFSSQWLNLHYLDLVNSSLSMIDKKLSCLIVSSSDKKSQPLVHHLGFQKAPLLK
jgi:chromosomal replication initiation ATPase DnaA